MIRKEGFSGYTGPTIILLEGKNKSAMLNYDYLVWNRINPWYTIIMI